MYNNIYLKLYSLSIILFIIIIIYVVSHLQYKLQIWTWNAKFKTLEPLELSTINGKYVVYQSLPVWLRR